MIWKLISQHICGLHQRLGAYKIESVTYRMCRSFYMLIKLELRLISRSTTIVLGSYRTVEMEADGKIIFMKCKTKVLKRAES